MKDFINLPFEKFKRLPCWNINFSNFEGLNTPQATFAAGVKDCYHVLIEEFELQDKKHRYSSGDKENQLFLGNLNTFKEIFGLKELADKDEDNLEMAYWIGVAEVQNIFKFLLNYSHPLLKEGDIVFLDPQDSSLINQYEVKLFPEIKAINLKTHKLAQEPKPNCTNKTEIYLDDLFPLQEIYYGWWVPAKEVSRKNLWNEF